MSLNACREEGLRDLDTSPEKSYTRTYKLKSKSDDKKYGNAIKKKKERDIRIAVLNVNSFPRTKQKQDKLEMLQNLMVKSNVDLMGIVELNCYWPMIPNKMGYMKKPFRGGKIAA